MKKKMLTFVAICTGISTLAKFDDRLLFQGTEDAQWLYVEKVFINDIVSKQKSEFKKIQKTMQAAMLLFFGYKWYEAQAEVESDKGTNKNFGLSDILNKGTFFLTGSLVTASQLVLPYLQKHIEAKGFGQSLVTFLQNWETNKELTPVEFHAGFETLVYVFATKGKEEIIKAAIPIIGTMQFLIKRHFASRFLNDLDPRSPLAPLKYEKAVTDIFSNAISTATKFGK